MRIPYAAQTLIEQVTALHKRAKAEPTGDPDGFNVYRTIVFDKTTSKKVESQIANIEDDRITGSTLNEDGGLEVTFSPSIVADRRHPFVLNEADVVDGD